MQEKQDLSLADVVFEDFLVEYYTNILKTINEQNNRKFKIKIVEKLLQNNLFLIKRLADPGFYRFICQEVLKDEKFLKTAIQFIKREVVVKLMTTDFFFNPFSSLNDWQSYNIPTLSPRSPIKEQSENRKNYDLQFINYFENQLKIAKLEGDLEKIKAIEVVLKDYQTYKYSIHELLVNPFSSEPFTLNFIKHYETNLKQQKLKLDELYEQISPTLLRLNYFILQTSENQKLVLIIARLISDLLEAPIEYAIILNKFINDLISVVHFKWFDLKDSEEKWNILNFEYPLTLKENDFKQIYENLHYQTKLNKKLMNSYMKKIYKIDISNKSQISDDNEFADDLIRNINLQLKPEVKIILYIIETFQKKGYLENAIIGCKFLLNLDISNEVNFVFSRNIGNLYRKLGEYEKAIIHYEKALDIIGNNYPYHRGLVHRNLIICYHFIEKLKMKQLHFSKVEEIAKELNEIDKNRLLLNLSGAFEITNEFEIAYDLVLKISSSDHQNEILFDLAFNKFQIYENLRLPNQSIDKKGLSEFLTQGDINIIKNYYKIQKLNFQFIEAKKSLERALKIAMVNNLKIEINLIVEDLTELYILSKNKIEFIKLFSNLAYKDLVPKLEIFKGIYLILINRKSEGMEIFKKFYRNYSQIDNISFTSNLTPKYQLKNIPNNMMPILWFFKPFINFNYNKIDDLIDNMLQCLTTDEDKGCLLVDIGLIYEQSRDMKSSIIQYGRALKFIRSNINGRIGTLLNIAGAYVSLDDFDRAKSYFPKILRFFDDKANMNIIKPQVAVDVFRNLSIYYNINYDYPNAIKYIKKAKEFSNDPKLNELEQEYMWLNERTPIYNLIDDRNIKNLLYSSDLIFNKISDRYFEIDYSLIILGYCKAIEMFLDYKITKNLNFSDIIEPFYEDNNLRKIRDDIWRRLPWILKKLFNYQGPRSVGIGQWPYILKDLSYKDRFKYSKPIYHEFLNRIEKLIEKDKRDIIIKSCNNLFEYRNQSAHTRFHSKEEFLEERPIIISNINNILSIFQ